MPLLGIHPTLFFRSLRLPFPTHLLASFVLYAHHALHRCTSHYSISVGISQSWVLFPSLSCPSPLFPLERRRTVRNIEETRADGPLCTVRNTSPLALASFGEREENENFGRSGSKSPFPFRERVAQMQHPSLVVRSKEEVLRLLLLEREGRNPTHRPAVLVSSCPVFHTGMTMTSVRSPLSQGRSCFPSLLGDERR